MNQRARGVAVVVTAFCLSGCAELTHLTASKDLAGSGQGGTRAKAVIVDAKQRLITASEIKRDTRNANGAVTHTDTYIAFCAEPSPDALSALAAGFGISLSKQEKADLASSFSIAEGTGSIGLRTQSIQLMRDAMFRLCEGYQSGAIDDLSFQTLHRRFQSSMVAILAIEQITGAIRGPVVSIGGNSLVGKAELAAELTAKKEAAVNLLREAEKTLAAKEKTAKDVNDKLATQKADLKKAEEADDAAEVKKLKEQVATTEKEKAEADTAVEAATVVKSDRSTSLDAIEAARAQAIAGGSSATMAVNVSYPAGSGPDHEKIGEVAKEVTKIVSKTLDLNFGREVCATLLLQPSILTSTPTAGVAKTCNDYLNENVKAAANVSAVLEKVALAIQADPRKLTPDMARAISELIQSGGVFMLTSP